MARASDRGKDRRDEDEIARTLDVQLAHARWRHALRAAVCLALAVVGIIHLGPFGKGLFALVGVDGLLALRRFVLTLVRPAGMIAVREDEVVLTPKVCSGIEVHVPWDQLRHAYFLRRMVPATTTGPVLIVETAEASYSYPRDWFDPDSDQDEVARVLNRRLGRI